MIDRVLVWPPLHQAAFFHDGRACQVFLHAGSNPNDINVDGMTAIESAIAGTWNEGRGPKRGGQAAAMLETAHLLASFGGELGLGSVGELSALGKNVRFTLLPYLDRQLSLSAKLALVRANFLAARLDAITAPIDLLGGKPRL